MIRVIANTAAAGLLLAATGSALADFDGRDPLLCSLYQLYQCDHPNSCVKVTPDEVGLMSHFSVNFRDKTVTEAGVDSEQLSAIDRVETVDNKLMFQGIEDGAADERDGAAWSVSILNPEGTMTLAVAGDGFGIMGLGACVPQ